MGLEDMRNPFFLCNSSRSKFAQTRNLDLGIGFMTGYIIKKMHALQTPVLFSPALLVTPP